jgi:hypothetical protein
MLNRIFDEMTCWGSVARPLNMADYCQHHSWARNWKRNQLHTHTVTEEENGGRSAEHLEQCWFVATSENGLVIYSLARRDLQARGCWFVARCQRSPWRAVAVRTAPALRIAQPPTHAAVRQGWRNCRFSSWRYLWCVYSVAWSRHLAMTIWWSAGAKHKGDSS